MIGSPYRVTVPISGTGSAGQVCGYLDFAHNGHFSAPEDQACADFEAGARSVTLTWPVPADTTAGLTYARVRSADGRDPTAAASPVGPASSGEVEDYALSILPTITVNESLPAGTAGTLALSVDNTVLAPVAANASSTGARTVGPASATLAVPDVTAATADLASASLAITVSQAPSAANPYSYTAAIRCVDGLGAVVATGNSMIQSVTIPRSAQQMDGRRTSPARSPRPASPACTWPRPRPPRP